MNFSRRHFLQLPAAAAAAERFPETGWRLRTKASKEIQTSPISIGFETLDRKMFDPERTYPYLAQLGVKWARCQTGWARTEQRKGEYDFAWLDSVVDSLLKIGIQPWFNLGYGNTLYTPGPKHWSAVGWVPLNSDEARQAWVRFVDKLAERFRTRVKHWELWNEPNIAGFWQPSKPSPEGYMDLVRLTAPVIRARVPGSVLIGLALAGVSDLNYIEGCFELGLGKLVDKISYHPYRAIPEENYEADLKALRGIAHRYKPGMGLWQGENGAPSTNNSTGALRQYQWDEARQAKWLLRRLLTDIRLGVEVTSYFQTVDMVNYVWSSGQSGQTNTKGVLRGHDYTPKASYYALQNLCALFDAATQPAEFLLRLSRAEPKLELLAVQCGTFVRQGYAVCAFWYPADLQEGFAFRRARISVWTGKAAKLENPVLVDLLTGEVTLPAKKAQRAAGWDFEDVLLKDYPMLITDREVVS